MNDHIKGIGWTWARRHLVASAAVLVALAGAGPALAGPIQSEATRFLEQASFGPTPAEVARVQGIGFEAWINDQFNKPIPAYPDLPAWPSNPPDSCDDTCRRDNYSMYPLQVRFFTNALTGQDQLRQRVVLALNQIFVVSALDPDIVQPSAMLSYLKVLDKNAFGNFRQLMTDVTLNGAMGKYLDMAGNRASAPNENFGRELLQLFTIGPDILNPDGTVKRDSAGRAIPSYDQPIITAFARVFTGWVLAPRFADDTPNLIDPMVPGSENAHDTKAKTLLNNVTLPAGQNAVDDLHDALDNIFAHPNLAPFISERLIQHLVTSNPSPAYVGRVAKVFKKTKGDMKSVIKAILLDWEARFFGPYNKPVYGHLKEPVLWLTGVLRAFNTTSATTDFVIGESFLPSDVRMSQDLFRAPSVFNFFPPDYVAVGNHTLGPEFKIYSTTTALARTNLAYELVWKKMPTNTNRPLGTWIDLTPLQGQAGNPGGLVDGLNARLLHGTMPSAMKNVIVQAVSAVSASDALERVRTAVYLVVTSPYYLVGR